MVIKNYYIVNTITIYRLVAAPVLLLLIIYHQFGIFKWLLAVSFFSDAIDGYLARIYKVTSKLGSIIDSVADDLTVGAAIIGTIIFKPEFLRDEIIFIGILLSLYLIQIIIALIRYHKISSFHTYIAKMAAILQGIFLILFYFLPNPVYILFYITACVTIIDLVEEIILALILPKWEMNVKGLYWIIKYRNST